MPDNLKSLLVDDWERVTKNASVVALPAPKTVRMILQDYRDEEAPKRTERRIDIDVLDEIVLGLLEYFDLMLDKILLYRYERPQYRVFRKKYEPIPGKGPVDVYGAEHFLRLYSMCCLLPFFCSWTPYSHLLFQANYLSSSLIPTWTSALPSACARSSPKCPCG